EPPRHEELERSRLDRLRGRTHASEVRLEEGGHLELAAWRVVGARGWLPAVELVWREQHEPHGRRELAMRERILTKLRRPGRRGPEPTLRFDDGSNPAVPVIYDEVGQH